MQTHLSVGIRNHKKLEDDKVSLCEAALNKAYESLLDTNLSDYDKYDAVYELSNNIEFVRKQDPKPLIDVINRFFKDLDLDKITIKKNCA